jgi:hypothetical protein
MRTTASPRRAGDVEEGAHRRNALGEGGGELGLAPIGEAFGIGLGLGGAGDEHFAVAGRSERHRRGHDHRLVGRRQPGRGVECIDRSRRHSHGGKLLAAELLELRRGLITQNLAHCARRAADADGDAGAAGDESEPDIDPGLADCACARHARELGVQGLKGGIGIDTEIEGELAARLAAAGERGDGAFPVGVGPPTSRHRRG